MGHQLHTQNEPISSAVRLFPSVLGSSFDALPLPVKLAHGGQPVCLLGTSTITRGTGLLSRVCAFFARLPPAHPCVETQVDIEVKSLGAVRFDFLLTTDADGFRWQVKRVAVFGLRLPAQWFSSVHAYSYCEEGSYRFLVHAQIPFAGLLVRYEGSLAPTA